MNRMREIRQDRNLSMKQVANDLKIPYTTYANYEKEDREPNSEVLIAVAQYFGVTVDYLIGRTNVPMDKTGLSAYIKIGDDGKEVLVLPGLVDGKILDDEIAADTEFIAKLGKLFSLQEIPHEISLTKKILNEVGFDLQKIQEAYYFYGEHGGFQVTVEQISEIHHAITSYAQYTRTKFEQEQVLAK